MRAHEKENKQSIKIVDILKEHWERFLQIYGEKIPEDMRESVIEAVEKAIKCGDPKYGYAEYICTNCTGSEKKKVAFTCKSRFCNRCGKVYIEKWVEKQTERILEIGHRHMVFTVPEELRVMFYRNRDWLKDLSDKAAEVIQYWYREKGRKRGYEVGAIAVIHTFGRDLKFNPHVHVLVTEGAIDKNKIWKGVGFIPYDYLRKAWQKVLLDWLKQKYPESTRIKEQINRLYKQYQKGFYVYAERRMKSAKGAAKYIGRYLARPAIAEYRILEYDGERVRFWYEDHETHERKEEELGVLEFIGRLIYHIPKKNFKMVRRYGLYRRDMNKLAQKIIGLWNWVNRKANVIKRPKQSRAKSWKERMEEAFGKNPLKCPCCGQEMELWRIWHYKYGTIWSFEKDGVIYFEEKEKKKRNGRDRRSTAGLGASLRRTEEGNLLQLSLSEMWV
ncbi:IS91 family transposase [Carboxydocella thermautotrophica]|uniref:Transposase zinc-binding domain-containing protein n=5 Tax=Carboxydocella TaxID=178898 RepID=A0A2R4MWR7_CARTR|nr:IS91 family transposase [Carboxydocella thermautotrophica]AVX19296.1 Transposase zinc-binding domain-containing protein [Carboxydocella thermautotrophica]AVX20415.1 Transposase zinc-binding domain-containing protein [Carboxydocella thermautotrophica]AVX20681.1 Transposase zinc-binding domain-containing protein [Carboxydocella thermautotrophica]AVX20874.1 Transposase zinc-binding domain-containing protein [Carboxydocella thermautotrophica]AVX21384.1 Transposase zinc-binding domain-containing